MVNGLILVLLLLANRFNFVANLILIFVFAGAPVSVEAIDRSTNRSSE